MHGKSWSDVLYAEGNNHLCRDAEEETRDLNQPPNVDFFKLRIMNNDAVRSMAQSFLFCLPFPP
jgi:hypothetical protein